MCPLYGLFVWSYRGPGNFSEFVFSCLEKKNKKQIKPSQIASNWFFTLYLSQLQVDSLFTKSQVFLGPLSCSKASMGVPAMWEIKPYCLNWLPRFLKAQVQPPFLFQSLLLPPFPHLPITMCETSCTLLESKPARPRSHATFMVSSLPETLFCSHEAAESHTPVHKPRLHALPPGHTTL